MTNAFSLFRSLVIYGICLPLAIFIGYLLTTPTDLGSIATVGLLLALMTIPLFLRFHYPWLIFAWNAVAGLYFLPGKPSLCLLMICISVSFSVLAYIMNRNLRFISAPSVARPLLFIAAVVIATARLSGGFGLNVLGSDAMGGKRYIYLLSGVVGFFALTAQAIPARKASLYVNLFFGGALTAALGNLFSIISPSFYFIFLIFPADILGQSLGADMGGGITRLSGLSVASVGFMYLLLARFGLKGILDLRKYWRLGLVGVLIVLSLFGGFRSKVIEVALTLAILFYLEGLMRSRLFPILILSFVLIAAFLIPFADKLPLSVQRSLTFLPLKLDMEAELNAQASTDWRIAIWSSVIPLIPQYLVLGKGLAIDARDYDMMGSVMNRGAAAGAGANAALAGDYHNGPLSVIIPFGIFGVIGLVWFIIAGLRALIRNYKYGDPAYAQVNRFLLTFFIVKCIMFFFVVGSFYSDLVIFVGPVAFSIALNGGILNPAAPEPVVRHVMNRFKLANATR